MVVQAGEASRPPQTTARTNQEAIRVKAAYFAEVGLWPAEVVDPIGWLENFRDDDVAFAAHLLNAFLFYNDTLLTQLIGDAIGSLASRLATSQNWSDVRDNWASLLANACSTVLPSSIQSPRAARLAAIERQVLTSRGTRPVPFGEEITSGASALFVLDDFMGGFSESDPRVARFRELAAKSDVPVVLCAALADGAAVEAVTEELPELILLSPHVLPSKYSVTSPSSVVWPDFLAAGANGFLERASAQAGLDPAWIDEETPALALAFSYRATAATVPLLLPTMEPSWTPLLRWAPDV